MRPVLAPVSVEDIFGVTVEAFNIAEAYQTPVIVLSDQEIGQRKETVRRMDVSGIELVERRRPTGPELESYERFRITESGISPISRPGMPGGNYLASGIEHNEHGAPTVSGEVHARMNDKRLRKFDTLKGRRDLFVVTGDLDAPLALISWGSVAGVAREALELARADGLQVKLMIPKLLYPIAEEIYQEFFTSVKAGLVVEQSQQGQLHRVIRMHVDLPRGIESLCKSGSNPILAVEVAERLQQLALGLQRRQAPGFQGPE